jgi:hypothetical protein
MEVMQKGLIGFMASFIINCVPQKEITHQLVQKMLKMKSVQKIITDTLCQLEPIISQEVLILNNIKPSSNSRLVNKKNKLLILADDIKNVMSNYEYIQFQVSSMLNIVDTLDNSLEPYPSLTESTTDPSPGAAFSYLSSTSIKKPISDQEINDISSDLWENHIEFEKLMSLEMEKYKVELNLLESKYHYREDNIKYKTGIKIKDLEDQLIAQNSFFRQKIDRICMEIEDKNTTEYETYCFEEEFLRQSTDSPIQDYGSALSKSLS